MTSLSHLSVPVSVPYRHKVSAVARIEPVNLNLSAPLNPYPKGDDKAETKAQAARGHYTAQSAAAGFAAQILVEAGLDGDDPFAAQRAGQAYGYRSKNLTSLRLVA